MLEVHVSARRTRLGLTVERDGALIVRVPPACPPERAEAFVRANDRWVDDKLRLREERQPLHPTRKLSDGEIHRYLGRDYRLLYVDEPRIEVRDVGRRWGTHRPGRIALHWATFQLPFHLIDYVIAHELAHVRISGHGPDYWRLLGRAMPEYARWKAELDEMGRRVWMGDVAGR
ncbi:M48 family metallopeptidase [Streptomyces javensis]|uniref:M48 family metallopeptidase n=1 Tax=Streptomyces javensis TaxID=114698 RepID=UPI0031F8CFFE